MLTGLFVELMSADESEVTQRWWELRRPWTDLTTVRRRTTVECWAEREREKICSEPCWSTSRPFDHVTFWASEVWWWLLLDRSLTENVYCGRVLRRCEQSIERQNCVVVAQTRFSTNCSDRKVVCCGCCLRCNVCFRELSWLRWAVRRSILCYWLCCCFDCSYTVRILTVLYLCNVSFLIYRSTIYSVFELNLNKAIRRILTWIYG